MSHNTCTIILQFTKKPSATKPEEKRLISIRADRSNSMVETKESTTIHYIGGFAIVIDKYADCIKAWDKAIAYGRGMGQ